MSDLQSTQQSLSFTERDQNAKTNAIIAYVLLLVGFFTGLVFIIGGIWAMVKKSDAQGTIFADHYDNIIKTFWVSLILGVIGWLTVVLLFGKQ